jgi:hypothetical protein
MNELIFSGVEYLKYIFYKLIYPPWAQRSENFIIKFPLIFFRPKFLPSVNSIETPLSSAYPPAHLKGQSRLSF